MGESSSRVYHIRIGPESYSVQVLAVGPKAAKVMVNGTVYEVELEDEEEPSQTGVGSRPSSDREQAQLEDMSLGPSMASSSVSERILVAPMPGDILEIKVQAGDEVELGQELFTLEAMKMKSAIRAGRAGVVEEVQVLEGQSVAYGQPLLTYK